MEVKLIDFYDAMHEVIPTAMREFYVERSKIFWEDVGGLEESKHTLQDNLIVAMNNPERFNNLLALNCLRGRNNHLFVFLWNNLAQNAAIYSF